MSNEEVVLENKIRNISLCVLNDYVLFDEGGTAVLDVEVTQTEGDSLNLYSGESEQVVVGARLFIITVAENGKEKKQIVGEFRAEGTGQYINTGDKKVFKLTVHVNVDMTDNVFLEIDLVKENKYWFNDAGFTSLNRIPVRKQFYISSGVDARKQLSPFNMADYRDEELKQYQKREEKSEVIIFSLLNSLKRISNSEI